jgi:drug/metabolite transporter (DMT)-like permease
MVKGRGSSDETGFDRPLADGDLAHHGEWVFLARWSLPALAFGTSSVRADVRRAPHLILWALLAGCLWAVANTLTIFAIRDIGLSIAFPLWNSNSLIGILCGFLFFNELRQAGWRHWMAVLGGAVVMCGGAALLAVASASQGCEPFAQWRVGRAGSRSFVGHDVRSVPESVFDGDESAFVHNVFLPLANSG